MFWEGRRLRFLIGILSLALFLLGFERMAALEPAREKGTLPTRPPTPYIHYLPGSETHRRALVVPGLDSNKEFMQILSSALADEGIEAYAIDLPGHGDSPVGFNGVLATSTLEQVVSALNPDIAIGHSMGAALLIDVAHDVKFRSLVLISPAPTEVNGLEFEHTLVTTERWDIPAVNSFVLQLEDVDLLNFQWGMHSSAPYYPNQIREIVRWLGGNPDRLHTGQRFIWLGSMFAGAIGMGVILLRNSPPQLRRGRAAERDPDRAKPEERRRADLTFSKTQILVNFAVAGGIAVIVQRFVVVLRWIHLYATDYLVSFLFVTGLVLLTSQVIRKGSIFNYSMPAGGLGTFAKAIGATVYVIVVLGLITGSHLIHMTLSDGRWWRFPVIAAASFPLFLFDETALRPAGSNWQSTGLFIITRGLLSAWIATGVLLFNHESTFVALLSGFTFGFWTALWFVATLVRRNVQSPAATALFSALVQGWMFAAWFVTT